MLPDLDAEAASSVPTTTMVALAIPQPSDSANARDRRRPAGCAWHYLARRGLKLHAVAACLNAGDLMLIELGTARNKPPWTQTAQ
jgi:hypothetical protein